jgi:hypothetical protein
MASNFELHSSKFCLGKIMEKKLMAKLSEPNEREAFREWYKDYWFKTKNHTQKWKESSVDEITFSAWQHQKKRIDELECSLQNWIDFSKKWESLCKEKDVEIESLQAKLNEKDNLVKAMDVFGGYEKLQAKLTIAVSIINVAKMDANFHSLFALEEKLSKALAEINIGE